jgi:mRNA interferase MazF
MGGALKRPSQAAPVRQYEIRWAKLPVPIGRRPVLLLTRSSAYPYLNKVIVAEVTSTIRGIPQELSLGRREGLARASVVNLDNVHVVPQTLLGDRIGALAASREREVKRALGYALDWPELKLL